MKKKFAIVFLLLMLLSVTATGFFTISAAAADPTTSSSTPDNNINFSTVEKQFKADLKANGLSTQAAQLDSLPNNVRMQILVTYSETGYKPALNMLLSSIETYSNTSTGNGIADTESTILNACAFGFNVIKGILQSSSSGYFDIPTNIVDSIINVLKPFAYAFVIICICINLSKKTLQFELFTAKGAISLFGEVFIAKVLIDTSDFILVQFMGLNNSMVSYVLNGLGYSTSVNLSAFTINNVTSNLPVIGGIVSIVLTLIGAILILLVSLCMLVCVWIMIIKLGIRAIELVMLRCVAPLFLSTIASSETSDIGKNFLRTFISTVLQTLFISISYVIMISIINASFAAAGAGTQFNLVMMAGIYVLTLTIFVVKTPRMLNQILVR